MKKKFEVSFSRLVSGLVIIEAESEEEALREACIFLSCRTFVGEYEAEIEDEENEVYAAEEIEYDS